MSKRNKKSTVMVDAVTNNLVDSAINSAFPVDRAAEEAARQSFNHTIETIVRRVEERLAQLPEGECVSMQAICRELSPELNIPKERLYHFVSMYANRRTDVHMAPGRDGGMYRGNAKQNLDPERAEKLNRKALALEAKIQELQANASKLRQKASQVVVAQA